MLMIFGTIKYIRLKCYLEFQVFIGLLSSMLLLSFFLIGLLFLSNVSSVLVNTFRIHISFENELPDNDVVKVLNKLEQSEIIKKDIRSFPIKFVSQSEAAHEIVKQTAIDFYDIIESNPLKKSLMFRVDHIFYDSIEDQLDIIKSPPYFLEIEYEKDILKSVSSKMAILSRLVWSSAIIVLFIVVIMLNNFVKLFIHANQSTIRIMMLVGAKFSYAFFRYVRKILYLYLLSFLCTSSIIISSYNYLTKSDAARFIVKQISLLDVLLICGLLFFFFSLISVYLIFRIIKYYAYNLLLM